MRVEVTDSGRKTSRSAATCNFGSGVGLIASSPGRSGLVSTGVSASSNGYSERKICSELGRLIGLVPPLLIIWLEGKECVLEVKKNERREDGN